MKISELKQIGSPAYRDEESTCFTDEELEEFIKAVLKESINAVLDEAITAIDDMNVAGVCNPYKIKLNAQDAVLKLKEKDDAF